MDTIDHSQTTDNCINETTETDFNSTLLDDGTLFSSDAVNTLNELEGNGQKNYQANDNNHVNNDTTNNTKF